MGAVRHFLRTTLADKTPDEKLKILRATFEINAAYVYFTQILYSSACIFLSRNVRVCFFRHPLIKKLFALQARAAAASGTPESADLDELCRLLCSQLYENALATAGLVTDPRQLVSKVNDLLTRAFLKLP